MRAKIAMPLILIALTALLLPLLHLPKHAKMSAAMISETPLSSEKPTVLHPAQKSHETFAPETEIAADNPTDQHEEDFVNERINELQNLAMTSDSNSLVNITSELDNREPRIRKAALNATVQFGSPAAIPALQDAIQHTDDLQEKAELQKAIEFLELPTMSEIAKTAL